MKKTLMSKRIFSILTIIIVSSCADENENYIEDILFDDGISESSNIEDSESSSTFYDDYYDGCDYYDENPYACDYTHWFDDAANGDPREECCACGGGND